MLLLNNADVEKVLTMPMCIEALEGVFQEMAVGDAVGMGRMDLYVPSGQQEAPYYRWAFMTGGSKRDGYVCARMLSDMVSWPVVYGRQRENKFARQPGTYCGLLFLFSAKNGEPIALINDGILQHVRVGGGAGLGAKVLSREDSQTVGIIGSGGMARTYLEAFLAVRPIKKVKVYSPNRENMLRYAQEMQKHHDVEVEPTNSAQEAVRGVDIVSCCTSAIESVFFREWLEPGMHVTDLNGNEIAADVRLAFDVSVRPGEGTLLTDPPPDGATYHNSLGLLSYIAGQPEERALIPQRPPARETLNLPTMVDLLTGRIQGRVSNQQTTYWYNAGALGTQFEAVAGAVYNKAHEAGLGTEIPTDWFLQNVRD